MKNLVSVLVIALFAVNYLNAQSTESLTNSTIIRMAKAKLSDDLILDEISTSKVNFNVSADSIKFLSDKNVSARVIQAMKAASGTQTLPLFTQPAEKDSEIGMKESSAPSPIAQVNDSLNKPAMEQLKAETLPSKELTEAKIKTENSNNEPPEKTAITVNAVGYVIPLQELMIFFDNEFNKLTGIIRGWDQQIRSSLEKGDQVKMKILAAEKDLTAKKNADSKGFTNEIIMLKKQLSEYRGNYKEFENNMVTDGLKIGKEIEGIGSELDRSIDDTFSNISQSVRKTVPDPSVNETPKSITITKQKINDNVVNYIAPVTEMLFCYQNEIISLRDVIELWNMKVITINKKDSELSKQLEPLKKELENYQLNPKENKGAISALKKQIANLEKERKLLTRQMGTDSKELSGSLTQICKEVQSSVKERLNDIIENIKYSYQDNFTYRDI